MQNKSRNRAYNRKPKKKTRNLLPNVIVFWLEYLVHLRQAVCTLNFDRMNYEKEKRKNINPHRISRPLTERRIRKKVIIKEAQTHRWLYGSVDGVNSCRIM